MASNSESKSGELPFKCEYEIGVQETDDEEDWGFYHPNATSEDEAEELALEMAQNDGFSNPEVYQCSGPFPPSNPAKVGEEVIEKFFYDNEDISSTYDHEAVNLQLDNDRYNTFGNRLQDVVHALNNEDVDAAFMNLRQAKHELIEEENYPNTAVVVPILEDGDD